MSGAEAPSGGPRPPSGRALPPSGRALPLGSLLLARPYHLAAGAAAAGLALSTGSPAVTAIAASAVAALLAACRAAPLGALLGALVLAGAAAGDARLDALDAPAAGIRDGPVHELRVHLATRPRPSPFGSSAEAVAAPGRLGASGHGPPAGRLGASRHGPPVGHRGASGHPPAGARLLLRLPRWMPLPRGLEIGAELLVGGRMRQLPNTRDGPDFAAYLRRRGVTGELLVDRVSVTGRRRGGPAGALDAMRRRAERGVAAGLEGEEAALARGMVLGQDEAIDASTRQDWRDSGLAHLLAVSGQNVMLLVALALPLFALARLGPYARGAALLVLVVLYVPLAGAGPSLQRAGIMGVAGIAAMMLSRPASRWYALLLAAALTLAVNPRASADPGWQLSFAAVAGILSIGGPLAASLARAGAELLPERAGESPPPESAGEASPERAGAALLRPPSGVAGALVRGVANGVAITFAATIATAPLLAFHFGAVPIAGLLANLLALPAVAPAMWLGMVKAALGLAAAVLPPADGLAELLGPPTRLPLAYLDRLAERCADLPGGSLALPLHSAASVALAYALLALALVAARAALGRRRRRAGRAPGFAERAASWRRAPRSFRIAVALLLAAAVLLASATGLGSPSPPGDLTVRFLDVGQGDATLVQHPDGTAVLFDGGPPEGGITRLLRRAGVRRLDVVVATHASRDHHGGLADVLARYPVGLLLDGGDGNPDPTLAAVRAEAARRGIRIVRAVAPMRLRAGGLEISVLSPAPRPPGPAPEDPNPRAVVAVVRSGAFDLLLSADAESEALLPLDLPDVEAMKVPHHGSSDPGLPAVLDRLRPELAAIEVGVNSYGHPAPSTLAALDHANVTTYRTDRDGTVTLTVTHGHMTVTTEH